jgi:mono/diheme cytochrome c family protein
MDQGLNPMPRRSGILSGFVAGAAALAVLAAHPAAAAADVARGKAVYAANCVPCHGPTGRADGPLARGLRKPPRDFALAEFLFDTDGDGKPGSDADLTNVIQNGPAAYGGSSAMTPWNFLKAEEIESLVAYIRTLSAAASAKPAASAH